jgi:hypothetical protein
VSPWNFSLLAVALLADFWVSFIAVPPLRVVIGMTLMLGGRRGGGFSETDRSGWWPRAHHPGNDAPAARRDHRGIGHPCLHGFLLRDLHS